MYYSLALTFDNNLLQETSRSDTRLQVMQKEAALAHGIDFIYNVVKTIREKVNTVPEVQSSDCTGR